MKKISIVVLALTAVLSACSSEKGSHNSMAPSAATAPVDLSTRVVWAVQLFPAGLTSNLYGNIQLGLATPMDPYGSQIRLRVYDSSGKRYTYIADYANSAPIGGTNDTLLRDITNYGKVEMALTMQPRGCTSVSCWDEFTFPHREVTDLIPSGQYSLNNVNGEVRLQGAIPKLETSSVSAGIQAMDAGMRQMGYQRLNGEWHLNLIERQQPDGSWVEIN